MSKDEQNSFPIQTMVYYSIMNLGIFMIVGFPNTYLYFLLQNELNFTLNQDYFRYLLITLGCVIGIICGPVFGYLSDRTKSRIGRRRLWIIIFSPLTAISFWFISVPLSRGSLIQSGLIYIYIILIYLTYSTFYNAMNIPYISLMADITPEDRRIQMSSMYNLIGGVGTGIILFLPSLLLFIVDSYIFVCAILSLIYISSCLITFFTIREPRHLLLDQRSSNKKSYISVIKDKNFIKFELAQCFWNMAGAIVMSSISAFAVTIFEIQNEFEFGLLGIFLLGIIGLFFILWNLKGESWGKKRSLGFSLLILSIGMPLTIIFSLTPPTTLLFEIPNFFKFTIRLPSSAIIPIQTQGIIWFTFVAAGYAGLIIFPYSILMGIVKKDQEATYIGFNSTFMSLSGALGTFFMTLLMFFLGAKGALYIVGPILGLFCFIALLILSRLEEN
ncbi:MAG: MFS transporter [Candidatus Helarchaeota archaeon]